MVEIMVPIITRIITSKEETINNKREMNKIVIMNKTGIDNKIRVDNKTTTLV